MNHLDRSAILLLISFYLMGCFASDGSNYTISYEDESYTFLVTSDGNNHRKAFSGKGSFPDWNPDGSEIVFCRTVLDHYQLFTFNVATSEIEQLTNDPNRIYLYPSWSTTGQHLIYYDGSQGLSIRRLTPMSGEDILLLDSAVHSAPCYSPLDTSIVFVSTQDGQPEIYKMTAQRTNVVRLTSHPDEDLNPRWSPNGDKIAFFSNRDGARRLYVMNVDGSDQQSIAVIGNVDFDWFPDGSRLAFVVNEQIYTVRADGTDPKQLTSEGMNDRPRVSPDGSMILFETYIGFSTSRIRVVGSNGKGLRTVSSSSNTHAYWPRWSPNPVFDYN